MIEEWREVEGFEGYYKVSNLGRVYSYARNIIRKLAKHKKNEQYLTLRLSKNGYKKDYQIHVLVFETYVRKIDKKKEVVHHVDSNPKNNMLENLKVMTRAEHNRLHKTKGMNKNEKENKDSKTN